MSGLSLFDLLYALALLAGMAAGFSRGFLRQLTGLISVYVGIAVAAQYTPFLTTSISHQASALPYYVTGSVVFLVVVAAVSGVLSLVANALLSPSQVGTRSDYDRSDLSQVSGLLVGAFVTAVLLAVSIPVTRYATAASWGSWDSLRRFIIGALDHSYLAPLLSELMPGVLASVRPLLPGGIPAVLLGKLL